MTYLKNIFKLILIIALRNFRAKYKLLTNLLYVSAGALIDNNENILIAKRPNNKCEAGKWEFPGGKIISGESPEEALIREFSEELSIKVKKECLAPLTFATCDKKEFILVIFLFVCRVWEGNVASAEGQELKWVAVNRLRQFSMPKVNDSLIAMMFDYL